MEEAKGEVAGARAPNGAAREEVEACLACGGTRWTTEVEVQAQMHPDPERFTFVRCSSCGLVFLNPRVPAAGLGRYYTEAYLPYRGDSAWGRHAPLVASGLRATDRKRVRLVERFGAVGRGSRVLDVGCGHPTFLERLVGKTGAQGIGIDFSDEGWRADPARWTGLDLREEELADLQLDEPADVVTMWHYLEHDYDPVSTLERVRELIRSEPGPSGAKPCLLIEVPNHDSWTRRRHGEWWAGYHVPRHTALYTPETLRTLLERAGWRVERILPYGTLDPYVLHWMSRMERRGIDWSESMEPRFAGFMAGKVASAPRFAMGRWQSMGIMTAVARVG